MVTLDTKFQDLIAASAPHMERMKEIDGWLSENEAFTLFLLASSLPAGAVVVEVGSFVGKSSVCIAGGLLAKGGELFCVDPFDSTDVEMYTERRDNQARGTLYNRFIENTYQYPNIQPIRSFSLDAARMRGPIPDQIDMVFIDANHEYPSVVADIRAWVPLLRPGGILAMHDVYYPDDKFTPDHGPVRAVVNLGIGLGATGWTKTARVGSLFTTTRSETQVCILP